MRIALDTNILAYAEGVNGEDRKAIATGILAGFARRRKSSCRCRLSASCSPC